MSYTVARRGTNAAHFRLHGHPIAQRAVQPCLEAAHALPPADWHDARKLLPDAPLAWASAEASLYRARRSMGATIAGALRHFPGDEGGRLLSSHAGRGRDGRLLHWIVGAREAMEGELARGGWPVEPLALLCPSTHG